MNVKPISPKMHGIIDYAFAGVLILLPTVLGFNKKARNLYKVLGTNLLIYNALTDQPVAVKPVISYQTHGIIDSINVAGIALATQYKGVKKDRQALTFHIAFLTLAAINVLLTDWKADPHTK